MQFCRSARRREACSGHYGRLLGAEAPSTHGDRHVATTALVTAFLLALGTFFLATGESVDARGVEAVPLAMWWASPFLAYRTLVRTRSGQVVIGLVGVFALVAGLLALYRTDSSTAAIGFVTMPMLLWLVVLGGLIAERIVSSLRHRST